MAFQSGLEPSSSASELEYDRRVVRGLVARARLPVDFAGHQPVGCLGRQQEVVDAQALVVVEGADHFFRDLFAEDVADAIEALAGEVAR